MKKYLLIRLGDWFSISTTSSPYRCRQISFLGLKSSLKFVSSSSKTVLAYADFSFIWENTISKCILLACYISSNCLLFKLESGLLVTGAKAVNFSFTLWLCSVLLFIDSQHIACLDVAKAITVALKTNHRTQNWLLNTRFLPLYAYCIFCRFWKIHTEMHTYTNKHIHTCLCTHTIT